MQTVWHRAETYIPIVHVARLFCLSERSVFYIAQDCFDIVISFPCINRLNHNGYKIQNLTLKHTVFGLQRLLVCLVRFPQSSLTPFTGWTL